MYRATIVSVICLALFAVISPADARIGGLTSENFAYMYLNTERFQLHVARIAIDKSRNEAIRRYARKIIDNYAASSERFLGITKHAKITAVDTSLTWRQRIVIGRMCRTEGKRFDRYYLRVLRKSNKRKLRLLRAYASDGENQDLRKFAHDAIPAALAYGTSIKFLKRSGRDITSKQTKLPLRTVRGRADRSGGLGPNSHTVGNLCRF